MPFLGRNEPASIFDSVIVAIYYSFFLFGFRTSFRPTKGGRLIRLVRRGMRTVQALFPLGIEPGIPQVRPWKELLATGAQATWLAIYYSIIN
jgi:hypothetical protein